MTRYKRPISQTDLREKNLSTLLYCLRAEAPISRANLANLTQLNKSTVSSLTEELLEAGVIEDVGLAVSGGGRPGKLLEINGNGGYAIGVEFSAHAVFVVLTDLKGQILMAIDSEIEQADQDGSLKTAVSLINQVLVTPKAQSGRIIGIGIAIAGVVDSQNGRLLYSPNLQWRHIDILKYFEDQFNFPIIVENNANAAALGEYFFGAAQLIDNFIFISVGKGIGAGIFLNGDLYRGASSLAGEVGQSHVVQGRRWLKNMDRQRWDSFANKDALLNRILTHIEQGKSSIVSDWIDEKRPLTLKMVHKAAEAGDDVVCRCVKDIGERIGLGIANMVHFIDPSLILLGGELATVGNHLLPHIERIVHNSDLIERLKPVQIEVSKFREDAILIGASTLVIQMAINQPKTYLLLEPALN
ncbi:MAG: ROK family protein [Chloroflexota bacterium]